MKKNKTKKSHIIVLCGAMAVGKLTVGKVLAKKLGYKLTHNHLINDMVRSVFERGTFEACALMERFRDEFFRAIAKSGRDVVITYCYSHGYVSPTGLTDPQYLKTLEKRLEKESAQVLFVHLWADEKTLLKRVKGESRKEHSKLTNASIMKKLLKEKDFITSAPVKNNLVIDNSKLSPQKVAQVIIESLEK